MVGRNTWRGSTPYHVARWYKVAHSTTGHSAGRDALRFSGINGVRMYRILTENKNRALVEGAVGSVFDGFTIYEGAGYWKGEREPCLIVEIAEIDPKRKSGLRGKVEAVAEQIKRVNAQEAVLVQHIPNNAWLI